MNPESWALLGMLLCLGLGYLLGWWARRQEVEAARSREAWLRVVISQYEGQASKAAPDSAAVERLLREL